MELRLKEFPGQCVSFGKQLLIGLDVVMNPVYHRIPS